MGILVGGALGSVLPGGGTVVGAFYGGAVANVVGGVIGSGGYYSVDWTTGLTYFWFLHILWLLLLCLC